MVHLANNLETRTYSCVIRCCTLLAVLVGEILFLSTCFDTASLDSRSALSLLLENAALMPQVAAVVLTGTIIFGGRDLYDTVESLGSDVRWWGASGIWFALHVLFSSLFFGVTHYLFETDRGSSLAIAMLWFVSGGACLVSLLFAALPKIEWRFLLRKLVIPLFIGATVGVLALALAHVANQFWVKLAFLTFQFVVSFLSLFRIEVIQDSVNLILSTPQFSVRIAPECSGYEGMGLVTVFVGTYLWWRSEDHLFPNSLLLIPLSIVLIFVANAVRIAALIAIGHFGFLEIAQGGFHSQAGWIAFNLVSLGIIAFARTCPFFIAKKSLRNEYRSNECHEDDCPRAATLLTPFVVLMVTVVIGSAVQSGIDWLYPLRVIAVGISLWLLSRSRSTRDVGWSLDWQSFALGGIVYAIWIGLEPFSEASTTPFPLGELKAQGLLVLCVWFAFRFIGTVVTVPIAEEMAFRGYLLRWLTPNYHSDRWSPFAVCVSSLAFGAMHPGRILAGTVAGFLFAMAFYRRKSVVDSIFAHATANLMIVIHATLTSRWNLWC